MADGRIDVKALGERLALCRGQMSAVIVAKTDHDNVIIIKGNKPLELIYHSKLRVVLYASSAKYFQAALSDIHGWERVPMQPKRVGVFRCSDLQSLQLSPFSFVAQDEAVTPRGILSI